MLEELVIAFGRRINCGVHMTIDAKLTNEYREFNDAENKTYLRCVSYDLKTGRMEDGTERPCAGCSDAQWRCDPKTKKNTRNCSTNMTVLAVDNKELTPFKIRFLEHLRTMIDAAAKHLPASQIGAHVCKILGAAVVDDGVEQMAKEQVERKRRSV